MKMIVLALAVPMLLTALAGCNDPHSSVYQNHSEQFPLDRDFSSVIRRTQDPDVFEVAVRRTNPSADKQISRVFNPTVDLTLVNSSGRVFAGDGHSAIYAQWLDQKQSFASLVRRVRLKKRRLASGTYAVRPRVVLPLMGRDAANDYVGVPAANSIKVKI